MMNMNPMQLIGLLKGRNPQELVMSMVKNNPNMDIPMINELIGFAQKGDINSVTKIAEDYFKQNGADFNNEYNSFMAMLK